MPARRPAEIAQDILDRCLHGDLWPREPFHSLIDVCLSYHGEEARAGSDALFRILVEGLADRFEPRLSEVYAEMFAEAVCRVYPEWRPETLVTRYENVRKTRRFDAKNDQIRTVFVLSRVTLGADIAITSLALDAAKRCFPSARIVLAGGPKTRDLFVSDPKVDYIPITYGRSATFRERLSVWPELRQRLSEPNSIVIDPDSRLTQLGLLPVCPDESYYLYESRAFGWDGADSLTDLMRRWLAETFDVEDASPYIAPAPQAIDPETVTVSLGVGENQAKRIADPFEETLLAGLVGRGANVLIDKGFGDEEALRAERLAARFPGVRTFQGSFAAFASVISGSRLYVGYDSAGQHAAAASGTPLVSVFAGFPCPRMFERWRPTGRGPIEIVRVDKPDPDEVLERTLAAVDRLFALR
ncbi:MAG TPA: glycosyltransferase family 9 protein [Bryobacteraceae bacterium]|nr:glycosyltransferase family 9 protein [Bryobacteraceae bacterium]